MASNTRAKKSGINADMQKKVRYHLLRTIQSVQPFQLTGTFEQMKKERSSDHTGASE